MSYPNPYLPPMYGTPMYGPPPKKGHGAMIVVILLIILLILGGAGGAILYFVLKQKKKFGPICNSTGGNITCDDNKKIKIETAFYGREDTTTCPGPGASTWDSSKPCSAPDAAEALGKYCDGESDCTIGIASTDNGSSNNPSFIFGSTDPCYGTEKYITGTFTCN